MGTTLLFVYGTLRLHGEANHLMSNCKLQRRNIKLYGYSLFNFGVYPFAVESQKSDFIVGDVYAVSPDQLADLDEYEGISYSRIIDVATNFSLYIKTGNNSQGYPHISSGNWLVRGDITSAKKARK